MIKDKFKWLVLLSAMAIVGMSGYYSVFGISSLFAGKRLFAGIMAGSLEFGKVTTTTLLTRNWKRIGRIYRVYFILATIILIVISSAGIYSYLTDAYHLTAQKMKIVDTELGSLSSEEKSLTSEKTLLVQDRESNQIEINNLRSLIDKNETRKAELYSAMNADTTGVVNWNASIWRFNKDNGEYRESIDELRTNKKQATNRITEIDSRLKEIWSESGRVETSEQASNIGPLKKLAELFNADMDKVVKFFIFILIIVFDPLGILLIVQFNKMTLVKNNIEKVEKKEEMKPIVIYTGNDTEENTQKKVKRVNKNDEKQTYIPKQSSKVIIDKEKESNQIKINAIVADTDSVAVKAETKNKVDKIQTKDSIVSVVDSVNKMKNEMPKPKIFHKDVSHKGIKVR